MAEGTGRSAPTRTARPPRHADGAPAPSPWILRFRSLVPTGGSVLDVACGAGRHTRLLLDLGHHLTAVDRDLSRVADLATHPRAELVEADLEGDVPVFRGRRFDGVIVTNYLHRPLLGDLVAAVARDGVLLYETFARGQERFGPPTSPDFLLHPGELLAAVSGRLRVVAYEDLVVDAPRPAAVQRICAVNSSSSRGRACVRRQ